MPALVQFLSANPATGDQTGDITTVLIVVGILCLVAIAALVVIPKLRKKGEDEAPASDEIEEINGDDQ